MSYQAVISTKKLRDNLAEILEKVAIGKQTFIISKFGKQKALITPVVEAKKKQPQKNLRSLPAFGMWKDRKDMKDSAAWVARMRAKQSFRIRE